MSADSTYDQLEKQVRELEHESRLRKKAEETLSRYEMIISTVNDPMSFVDRDYIYRTVNDAYAKVFQRSREEIVGRSVADLLGSDVFEDKIKNHIDKCLAGEEVHYEDWFDYPSWGHRYVIMSYYPFYENEDTVGGIAVTASDITEHKLTEDALRKTTQELLIRNEIDGIFLTVTDEEVNREILRVVLAFLKISYGIFGHVNHRGEMVYNSMTWDEHQGCRSLDRDVIFSRELWGGIWAKALTEKASFVSTTRIDVPRGYIPITDSMIVPVIYQGEVIGAFIIANGDRDLGDKEQQLLETIANHIAPILKARLQRNQEEEERKKAQEELRKANDELEEMVARRTAELMTTNKQLLLEIEERKRIHKALVQSKEMLSAQYRGFPVPTFTLQMQVNDFALVDFNTAAEVATQGRIAGYIGKGFDELSVGLSSIRKDVKGCYHDKNIITKEIYSKLFTTDEEKYINLTCSYVPPDMVMIHMEDITERKKAENALKASEESLRTLSAKLFKAKEEERKHISRELHDGIGQYLASIKFITENIINRVEKGPCAAEIEPLRTSVPIIQTIIDEVRKLSMNLRPSTLDDFGICVTIDWFCKEYQKIYEDIHVLMDIDIVEDEIPDDLKIIIFRILQEALNNVATHAQASSVKVALAKSDEGISLIIRDDGVGFDMHSKKTTQRTNRGLGLVSMKERTELLGGAFHMNSAKGVGTTIHAFWPGKDL